MGADINKEKVLTLAHGQQQAVTRDVTLSEFGGSLSTRLDMMNALGAIAVTFGLMVPTSGSLMSLPNSFHTHGSRFHITYMGVSALLRGGRGVCMLRLE